MRVEIHNPYSAGNPTLEPNITSIGKPVAKLLPIYILKMAVGRHLGFYRTGNSAIRSADAENLWTRSCQNQIWSGLNAPSVRYSPLNYTVTLKLRFGINSRSLKAALFDRAHTNLYSSSSVNMTLSITVSKI